MKIYKVITLLILTTILLPSVSLAHEWHVHRGDIEDLERDIFKLQQELDTLVEKKKKTRERARIEQTLQRIVEIHAELISMRKTMDQTREHLKMDHPTKVAVIDEYDSRMQSIKKAKKSKFSSPLSRQLDMLMIKVQMKYSSFIKTDEKKAESIAVEKVIQEKEKRKKEREADVYLRRRSKIKLVK